MFSFTEEQTVFQISGISIGGQPGQHPTVLFGGVFFQGEPDFEQARRDIDKMFELSRLTGNPAIPDFFIRSESHVEKIIDFIVSTLPHEQPFSVDLIEPDVKPTVLKYLAEKNLLSRTIYNSINIGVTEEERKALKRYTPAMAIMVAFNPKDSSVDGKIEMLENSAHLLDEGLIDIASNAGIEKVLVDTAALAPGENSGASIAALPVIKEEYGLPAGCAIHNVVEKSEWLISSGLDAATVDAASNVNIPLFGGDYAIFGPVQNAPMVFPTIAWEDILLSEYAENYFGIEPDEGHPRRRVE